MNILGCDPGVSGALAIVSGDPRTPALVTVRDMPTLHLSTAGKERNRLDHSALGAWLMANASRIDHAVIEQVGAMPKQGVSSTFQFGMSYGALVQALASACIPYGFVTPRRWQAGVGLAAGGGKDASLALAKRLWPVSKDEGGALAFRLARHHGRADAALMAWWHLSKAGAGQ